VEIHYAIGGAGEPVFLLHGTPKTMSYWRHVVPLLTPHYTVIAVDNRGAGGSQRPLTGYDTATMAGDVAELATHLGFEQFRVAGEDWGAAIAYAVAAFHRPRVKQLVFQETLLPGLPFVEPDPLPAADDMRTGWHFSFFGLPNVPELLLAGRERPFWTWYTPDATCGTPARWPRRTSTARTTPTRSAAPSWRSALRTISGTRYPDS
jgi:pimeloyl-ACP methyl ester carboxylesterase